MTMTTWLGTKKIEFVWHGEWADPELGYKGRYIEYPSIEDFCCSEMKDEGLDFNNDEVFAKWVRKNEKLICATIVEFADAKKGLC